MFVKVLDFLKDRLAPDPSLTELKLSSALKQRNANLLISVREHYTNMSISLRFATLSHLTLNMIFISNVIRCVNSRDQKYMQYFGNPRGVSMDHVMFKIRLLFNTVHTSQIHKPIIVFCCVLLCVVLSTLNGNYNCVCRDCRHLLWITLTFPSMCTIIAECLNCIWDSFSTSTNCRHLLLWIRDYTHKLF